MMIVFTAVFLLAAVPGSGAGGHKRGFLAFETPDSGIHPSFKEKRLWDEFQESERKRSHSKSADIMVAPPGGPPPPSHITPVDYTVEVVIGPSPCEMKIQKCQDESKICGIMLEDLGAKIAAAVSKSQDLANHSPLLNTLQMSSDVQSNVPLVEFAKNSHVTRSSKQSSAPSPSIGTVWARIDPVMKPVDAVANVDWSSLARLNMAKERLQRTALKIEKKTPEPYLHQEFRSPDGIPLSRIPAGMEHMPEELEKHVPEVAQGIAQHIAEVLPKSVARAAADQLNSKCNGVQTLMLDDCLSFAQACRDDLAEKKHRFAALGQTIRDHEEERQGY